ncbi:MAG: aminopeptidase P N-terminal domain-containing protein [Bacteroidota bacterium]
MNKIVQLLLVITLFFSVSNTGLAQNDLPSDYLSSEFHKNRRDEFRKMMPDNSMAVIFANTQVGYNFLYHLNPDLYYLSGYRDADAVLFIFSEKQTDGKNTFNEVFFVPERNPVIESWNGKRLGVNGVKKQLGFSDVYPVKSLNSFNVNYDKFDYILYGNIPVYNNKPSSDYDLKYIIDVLKTKIHIDRDVDLHKERLYIAKTLTHNNISSISAYYIRKTELNNKYNNDPVLSDIINNPDSLKIDDIITRAKKEPVWGTDIYKEIITTLRQVKTEEEITLLRKAVNITCKGHVEVMRTVSPEMSEREIEGIHTYIHRQNESEIEGYSPIIGSGENGCILHYAFNSKKHVGNNLVLMDVGAEYHGYSADVTRTIPATGKFTKEQRQLYELVYQAQEEVFKLCKAGTQFAELDKKAKEILANGLLKMGIINSLDEVGYYYPHGCSHYLGLDVHDIGDYQELQENMVITVEPGIYIPEGSKCDKKWWNIAIRIEDDVLIKKDSCEILSLSAPRKWNEIEKIQKQKSSFQIKL